MYRDIQEFMGWDCMALMGYWPHIPSVLHGFSLMWDRGGAKHFDVDASSTQNMSLQ